MPLPLRFIFASHYASQMPSRQRHAIALFAILSFRRRHSPSRRLSPPTAIEHFTPAFDYAADYAGLPPRR